MSVNPGQVPSAFKSLAVNLLYPIQTDKRADTAWTVLHLQFLNLVDSGAPAIVALVWLLEGVGRKRLTNC